MASKSERLEPLKNLQSDLISLEKLYIKGFINNSTYQSTRKKIEKCYDKAINDLIKLEN